MAENNSEKKTFSLLIPPPNLTGELHLGHAMQHSILDAIARFKRLQGFNVLLLPGVDHAGIQFEATLDKKLASDGKNKKSLGREKWLDEAWKFKDEVYNSVSKTWRFMGLSADWNREVFTLDEGPQKAVFYEFKTFFERGLTYKGPYIVQWCPKDRTAIEDVEMEYEERKEKLYYVKYKVKGSEDESIAVATTRPETIFADTAIAIYPKHPKFKKFVGMFAINPLTGDEMPIFEDKRIEKGFGTGALKVTPGHDLLDYKIGKDNNLPIKLVVNKEGRLTELAGDFAGLKVAEAKEKVVDKLKDLGALVKVEEYVHSVAVCERCKSVVEPLISAEWFVKVEEMAKEAVHVINANKIKFLPPNYKKILVEWLLNIHDWCISRSLWWGHRIPVWYCFDCNKNLDPFKKGAARVSLDKPSEKCSSCGSLKWVQDEQVLDTWFSSGLWPISTLGWPFAVDPDQKAGFDPELGKFFPWDFEISAPEIKYLWIARMIMLSNYFTGSIPFKTMFFHGMLRDLEGRKFSKSLGNGIEPQYLIDKWGVDATRMALYTYAIPGRDGRVSKQILDERGKNFRNFGTKLTNITRFILELAPDEKKAKVKTENNDDRWIEDELDKTTGAVTKYLETTQLHLAIEDLYEFVWHKFADKYIEMSKKRRSDAQPVLENVLKQVLILLHPFMPFITDELYQKFEVKRKSISLENWPSSNLP